MAEFYQQESKVKLPRERTRQVRQPLKQEQNRPSTNKCMNEAITLKEVEAAIGQLKSKKAPGPDGVTNDMIKLLGLAARNVQLTLFNES